jgi:hypothetical protein
LARELAAASVRVGVAHQLGDGILAGLDVLLAHISPARSENVNFFGVITVGIEAELAKLGPAGWRPLRPAAPDLSTLP